jgi:hypothetical protein
MSSSQNLASQRSNISASLSSKEKLQSKTKLQCLLATMTISVATPNRCISLISTVAGDQKIGKRTLDHLRKKGIIQPSTRGLLITITKATHQAEATVMTEARTHLGLCTACFMAAKPTTAQKIAPYSSNLKERWSKTLSSLHSNHHLEKSTISCSGLLITNTLYPTLRFYHRKPTKTPKPKFLLITSYITMLQPTILSLYQLPK